MPLPIVGVRFNHHSSCSNCPSPSPACPDHTPRDQTEEKTLQPIRTKSLGRKTNGVWCLESSRCEPSVIHMSPPYTWSFHLTSPPRVVIVGTGCLSSESCHVRTPVHEWWEQMGMFVHVGCYSWTQTLMACRHSSTQLHAGQGTWDY